MFRKHESAEEGRPLPGNTIVTVLSEHARRYHAADELNFVDIVVEGGHIATIDVKPIALCYSPISGRYAGPAGALDERGRPQFDFTEYLCINDDFLPSAADISEHVRLLPSGHVAVDGTVGAVLAAPPFVVEPEPDPTLPPAGTPGHPLPDSVISRIVREWHQTVNRASAAPRPNGYNPTFSLAFSAATGRFVATHMTPDAMEHAHQLVWLRDDEIPTAEQLRRVRIHSNSVVSWAEAPAGDEVSTDVSTAAVG